MKTNKRLSIWVTSATGMGIVELVVEDTQWHREYHAGHILAEIDLPEPTPEEATKELLAVIDGKINEAYVRIEDLKSHRQNLLALPAPEHEEFIDDKSF